jgi:dihydrolipoamide dehydrogenase
MPAHAYDLIVIGAGPGGYVAAIRAAQLGMKVACVEKDRSLGGTCLNVGCIPSKALLDSSERFHQAREGLAAHGIKVAGVDLDLAQMMARKDKVVTGLTRGIASLFKKNDVTWLAGTARFADPHTLVVSGKDEQQVQADRILIATGSAPIALPKVPFDGTRIITSTEALALPSVPRRLLVVGGGAVGLEMGSVWSRLGADVLVVEMLDRLVPGMDTTLAKGLKKSLEKQGLAFRLGTQVVSAEVAEDGVHVTLDAAGQRADETFDIVLVAVGRRPYTENLGLEDIGVTLDERRRIPVNERFETNVPNVFAIGDVIPGAMLAHKAEEEGIAAVENMAGLPGHVSYDAIPSIVYTSPELAGVGMTEEEATRRGLEVQIGTFPFLANGRARCMNETEGSVRIIADAKTDRILGIHILAAHASDLIAEAALAMEFSASAEDLARSVHAHPTLAEAVKEAALAVAGRAIHA